MLTLLFGSMMTGGRGVLLEAPKVILSPRASEFFFWLAPWVTVLMMEGCGLRPSRSSSSLSSITCSAELVFWMLKVGGEF